MAIVVPVSKKETEIMKRRDFLKTSVATATAASTISARAEASRPEPLRAEPRVRILHLKPEEYGAFKIISDGCPHPRKLVRSAVLDARFGKGTSGVLLQPDHWRMIEEGWFSEEELYRPAEFEDPAFRVWHATYKPEVEAHDLLLDLFSDRIKGSFCSTVPELGLTFAEHPCTPRLATVTLAPAFLLPDLAEAIAERTEWLLLDTDTAPLAGSAPATTQPIH